MQLMINQLMLVEPLKLYNFILNNLLKNHLIPILTILF